MRKFFFLLLVMGWIIDLKAQNIMTEYQYWFDADFAQSQTATLSGNEFNASLATGMLDAGLHTLHFRARQSDGRWSSVVSQNFLKPGKLLQYEYWFDDAYANRVTINTNAASMIELNQFADAAALNPGTHWVHFRFKREDGSWSNVMTQQIEKPALIDAYEYWFDEDYANKVMQSLQTPLATLSITDQLPAGSLDGAYHQVHYRMRKQDGAWSTCLTQAFNTQNDLLAFEYWFNDNYASKITQSLTPATVLDLNPQIDVSMSPLGSNTLFIRFKDRHGRWSPVLSDGFCHNNGDSSIHLKLFLQGYYTGSGSMGSVLLNQGAGTSNQITDSIDVELRSVTAPYTMVATSRAALQTDGHAKVDFPFTYTGLYYLAVKHRNSLETWSASPVFRGECPLAYDFTTNAWMAFGGNQKEIEPNTWAFYTGDINQDENIDLLDISSLENDINTFQFGYFATDLNGDGNVDLLDGPVLEENVNGFIYAIHP